MKIWNSITIDIASGKVLAEDCFEYYGPIELAKADGTAKDQLKLQNQLVQSQLTQQQAIRDQIMGSVGKYLSGNVGFDPQQLAIMQSQFLNQNTANFNQAGSSIMSSLRARGAAGGDAPVGGDFTRGLEALQGARASSQSQGILGTNLANLQQALSNQFNAASVAAGQSAQIGQNVSVFNSGASNALEQYVKAANTGFGSAFTSALGGALGTGLGKAATGFVTGGLSSLAGLGGTVGLKSTISPGTAGKQ